MRPTFSRPSKEAPIERWCCQWARAHGIITSKLRDPTGIPDHLFWVPGGAPVVIEFKRPGKKPTPLQTHYLVQLLELGYRAYWVDDKETFLSIMENHGVKSEERRVQAGRSPAASQRAPLHARVVGGERRLDANETAGTRNEVPARKSIRRFTT